jgi:hypothetical protein
VGCFRGYKVRRNEETGNAEVEIKDELSKWGTQGAE